MVRPFMAIRQNPTVHLSIYSKKILHHPINALFNSTPPALLNLAESHKANAREKCTSSTQTRENAYIPHLHSYKLHTTPIQGFTAGDVMILHSYNTKL